MIKNKLLRSALFEPYWVGSLPQILIIAAAISTALYGIHWTLAFIAFAAFGTFGIPAIKLGWQKVRFSQKNKDNKPFQLKYFEESWIPDSFPQEDERERISSKYFDFVIYLFHFLHFAMFFITLATLAYSQSYLAAILIGLSWGFFYAPVAESYSHEFVHRRSLLQQMLGGSVWATFFYGTFLSEHCMGHHVHVSTPGDASSARKNQTVYEFLPNAIINNPINGFKLEAKRLRNHNKPVISVHNRILWLTLLSFVMLGSSYLIAGSVGLVFFLVQIVGSILTIEVANYVMHYGLERRKLENGRYERVSPLHSWNREGPTHMAVINLIRHSDHHAFPMRPYPILRNFPEAPELPLPYELLLYLPYFPKLWFKVMNPAVDLHMNKLREWQAAGIDDFERVMAHVEQPPAAAAS